MPNEARPHTPHGAERPTLLVLYAIASLVVLFVFLVRPGMTGHHRADFPDLVYGTAHKPYVSRALVPLAVRGITVVTPEPVRAAVWRSLVGRNYVEAVGWYDDFLFQFAVATALMLACLVGFAWTLKRLSESVYDLPPVVHNLGPLGTLVVLPLFFRYYSYPYDPATLLLFALCALWLIRGRFVWFLAGVALASANKETSILLIPLFVLHARQRGRGIPVARALAVIGVWAAVRGALMWVYRDNPGAIVENHFVEHTVWLVTKFPPAMRYTLVVALLFFLPLRDRWGDKPVFLRAGLGVTLAPLVVAGSVFGFADELRGYYEAFPFLYLLALPSLARWLGGRDRRLSGATS